ncbi:hypothetical protein THAPSDRAFT_21491 [Thalassiosira pseudonana CCMP1335]|uniref:Eukaryotic translation initiation factor 3 subunit K n=1 Tax=Thalassiosira pseudonana TaxID=35128 RepID=B8BVJ5_THAPS|nr:hypothetical protein THAPSDRAFT_21491 [Thalassiosira pseudonana CCMP1335]EED94946.1 hypothetical protein THAPSDRAFT_21491 [Thalassiosira pseudonana CCMP1335]
MTVSQIPTHGEIQALLSTSAYDPAIVSKLEAYVRAQVSSVASSLESDAQYSFEANRTLVKLYQFFPHLEGELGMTVTALAAFLALLQFPETDFMALGCLIPERVQSMEPCATLVRCAELLESCQFSEFWPEFRKLGIPEYGARDNETVVSDDRKLLSNAVNGSSASNQIRINMIQMLARTYRSAPLSSVLGALDLKDVESLKGFSSKVMLVAGGGEGEVTGTENEIPIVEKIEGDLLLLPRRLRIARGLGQLSRRG